MMVPRGKVTGGSSAINGQIFLRGVPEDYDNWASWGNEGWSYEDCLPLFRKLETDTTYSDDFHGTDGPIICHRFQPETWQHASKAFYQSCLDYGFEDCPDHNDPDSTGVGPMPLNNPNGIRWSTNLGYLSLSRHRLNLTIRPNCVVHRIEFDGSRATGVVVESGGETFTVEGEEIILSAGAIGSPQILMVSGVGPSGHLNEMGIPVVRDLPGVGQNLRDHPLLYVTWKTRPGHGFEQFGPRMQFGLRYTATGSDLRNDMIVYMNNFATERIDRGGDRMSPIGVRMLIALNLAMGAGEIKLQSADPYAQPILDYNYFTEEFDRERMREAVRICANLGEHEAWSRIIESRIEPPDETLESDDALRRLDDARSFHRTPHLMHQQDGPRFRSHGRRGQGRQGTWTGGSESRRRLHYAGLRTRQHQRHRHDDGREDRRGHQGRAVTPHCHSERSAAEPQAWASDAQMRCHSERSAAEPKNLKCPHSAYTAPAPTTFMTLPSWMNLSQIGRHHQS